jgi:hypothetical protein
MPEPELTGLDLALHYVRATITVVDLLPDSVTVTVPHPTKMAGRGQNLYSGVCFWTKAEAGAITARDLSRGLRLVETELVELKGRDRRL